MMTTTKWPDLTVDQRAWELAKTACGPDAPLGTIIARAQQIKNVLNAEAL